MFHFYRPSQPTRWHWLTLSGPDAADFLHRITTANIHALQLGQGVPACLLSPQGRFRSFFRLWQIRDDAYGFELDGGQDDQALRDFMAAIDQYTFAEKITLTEPAGFESLWLFPNESEMALFANLEANQTRELENGLRVTHHGSVEYGRPILTIWGLTETVSNWFAGQGPSAPLSWDALELERIRQTRPRVGPEVNDGHNPLEVGLKDSIADNKGCYPGQEVIEKIMALGAPAKRLARIEGQGAAPALGEKILNLAEPAAAVGEVTSVSKTDGGFAALGIVRKVHAKEGLEVRFGNGSPGKIAHVAEYR